MSSAPTPTPSTFRSIADVPGFDSAKTTLSTDSSSEDDDEFAMSSYETACSHDFDDNLDYSAEEKEDGAFEREAKVCDGYGCEGDVGAGKGAAGKSEDAREATGSSSHIGDSRSNSDGETKQDTPTGVTELDPLSATRRIRERLFKMKPSGN